MVKPQVEVTMKLVVESDIDPRSSDGRLPYEFKHLQPTERVTEFLEHLEGKVAEWFVEVGGSPAVVEFEILEEDTNDA